MGKVRKFEDILDQCLERMLVRGETVEQCLQSFPEYSDRLKPLLETALVTSRLSALQPRPEFRERARSELRSAFLRMEQKPSRSFFSLGWQPRWAMAVVTLLVVLLAGGGTVAAASNSMPDSPLYPVKRVTEQAQLALTFSDIGKAELYARLADKRVAEIAYLAEKDKPEEIVLVAESLNTSLVRMTTLVSPAEAASSFSATPPVPPTEAKPVPGRLASSEPAVTAEETTAIESKTAAKEVPPPASTTAGQDKSPEPPAKEAPQIPGVSTTQPVSATPEKAVAPGPVDVRAEAAKQAGKEITSSSANSAAYRRNTLKTAVEVQAEANIARLRALLATAPESARPALQQALSLAEEEYKKIIKALE